MRAQLGLFFFVFQTCSIVMSAHTHACLPYAIGLVGGTLGPHRLVLLQDLRNRVHPSAPAVQLWGEGMKQFLLLDLLCGQLVDGVRSLVRGRKGNKPTCMVDWGLS